MRSVVDGLVSFAGRGACTDAERRAAVWLHDELRARGHRPYVETRWVRPQRYATVALGSLLAVAGGLIAVVEPAPGLVLALLAALLLAIGRPPPFFPRRATQDVLTAPGELVIVAAYDAPRRGLMLNDRPRAWLRRAPPGSLALAALVVAATAAARLAEVDAAWLGAVQLLPTVVLLVAFAAALDVALSGWSPGANDNASGVAVALELYDRLRREGVDAGLLLVGAGHATRTRTHGLELGPCGAGTPRHEGGRIDCVDERGIAPRAHQADDTSADEATMEAALELALSAAGRAAPSRA